MAPPKQHRRYDVLGTYFNYAGQKVSSGIVEFVGTFFLVLTIGLNTQNAFAPLAIGSILMVMIFMGGHISGAHYNPAVTTGVRLTGRDHITTTGAITYVFLQLVAGFAGASVAYGISGVTFAPMPCPTCSTGSTFAVEFLYTFALVSVMLNCATTKSQNANSFFGLAIGFTVVSGAFTVGSISGGAFNPAVATGPTILHSIVTGATAKHLWIYWLSEFMGAGFAAVVFRVTNTKEYRKAAAIAQQNGPAHEGYTPVNDEPEV